MDQVLSQGPLFIVCLIFMMGIVVVVHEFGHYLAARYYGAAVESFSVGFGKTLFERRDSRGTRWRLNMVPLGGFVAFIPEPKQDAPAPAPDEPVIRGVPFDSLKPFPKIVVSLAGPVANFILAILMFALIIWANGIGRYTVVFADVLPGQPAAEAGVEQGDRLLQINGREIRSRGDALSIILVNPNQGLTFSLQRGEEMLDLIVTPQEVVRPNEFGQIVPQSTIGVRMGQVEWMEPVRHGPLGSLAAGTMQTGRTIEQTVTMLSRIITGNMSIHTMSGPVGIGDISRRVVNRVVEHPTLTPWQKTQQLFWMLMSLCAAVSVGVGFFNLLPLPVLDGGRVVFHAYEAVTGARLPGQVEAMALRTGLFLLLLLVVVITWGDILETGLFGRGGG
ncbi:M50 family metallopeptidase [Hyphomonas sp.]|uniref:M50 family metallopeptidase n=1 Tax=Hyphomonas sp. TaxID=87 RepID=UPI00391D92F3